ncbi:MAG: cytochrome C [Gammaproteobacteria bacterium SG8_47]|nr:MAG: cytochrome C [Gammaproteobacteria bacterium SG8_47]
MNDATVYLNGDFVPASEAKVSVLDRGFIFGDGVYEVIPAYGGHLLRLEHHLARLGQSLSAIRLANPLTDEEWADVLSQVVSHNEGVDQSVYLQVTRGVARRDHAFPPDTKPTVFVMSTPLTPLPPALREHGAEAITLEDIRWQYCNIKAIALLPNVLLRQQAIDTGAMEAILYRNGVVTEGAASNVFAVSDGLLLTPPKSDQLLPGITRDLVVELAHEHNIACSETALSLATLRNAEEIWLTSSTKEIVPVRTLDGNPVGEHCPGKLWHRMYGIYQDYKAAVRAGERA